MAKRRNSDAPYWRQVREAERRILVFALENTSSMREAARALGISPSYCFVRCQTLGLRPKSNEASKPKRKKRSARVPRRATESQPVRPEELGVARCSTCGQYPEFREEWVKDAPPGDWAGWCCACGPWKPPGPAPEAPSPMEPAVATLPTVILPTPLEYITCHEGGSHEFDGDTCVHCHTVR